MSERDQRCLVLHGAMLVGTMKLKLHQSRLGAAQQLRVAAS